MLRNNTIFHSGYLEPLVDALGVELVWAGEHPHHLPGLEVAHAHHAHGLAPGPRILLLRPTGLLCPRVPEVDINYVSLNNRHTEL